MTLLSSVFSALIFLAHAGAAVWLLFNVFDTEKYCTSGSNNVHYYQEYVNNIVAPASHGPPDAWPVFFKDYRTDSSYFRVSPTQSVLNAWRCMVSGLEFDSPGGLLELHNITSRPALVQACSSSGLHATVELPKDRYSGVLGSSNNILYLMLLFEWISASFALFYMDVFPEGLDAWFGKIAIISTAVAWNASLLLLTCVMAVDDKWVVPTNNVVLGLVTLVATVVVQVAYAVVTGAGLASGQTHDATGDVTLVVGDPPEATVPGNPGERSTKASVLRRRRVDAPHPFTFFRMDPVYTAVHNAEDVLETQLMGRLRERLSTSELRYLEYAISAPILMLGVQSTIVLNSPIWPLQLAYVGMLATNLLGVPLHKCVVLMLQQNLERWQVDHFRWAAYLLLLSSWGVFSASWVTYFESVFTFFGEYPTFVAVLVTLLPVFYSMFGIAASAAYLLFATYTVHYSNNPESVRSVLGALNTAFDVFSLSIKLMAVFIIVASDQFGPSRGCVDGVPTS